MGDLDNENAGSPVSEGTGSQADATTAPVDRRTVRGRRLDRGLLVVVLVLQVLILAMLLGERRNRPAGHGREDAVAGAAGAISAPTVGGTPVRRVSGADDPAAVAASLRSSRAMFDRMDALFEQTVSEIAAMDRLFDSDAGWQALPVSPFLDMRDTGNRYVVVYGVPGMRPSDVQVVLDDRILTIRALLEYPPYVQHFGRSLQMDRSVRLPGPVGDPSEASAGITNGLLRVDLPKSEASVRVLAVPVRLF